MKQVIFFLLAFYMTACCKDDFHTAAEVNVIIFKDGKTLKEAGITPSFHFVSGESEEVTLPFELDTGDSLYFLQSSYLKSISFKPATILIRYNNLPETDTLEILLDYECKSNRCACKTVVLKYMKCNSVFLDDHTIRK